MNIEPLILVAAVAGVGVLHTIVPDHWVPLSLIARQRGWSRAETALASFQAGVGHVLSTLAIGIVVWIAGVAFATRFGNLVDTVTSAALVAFGGWIAIASLREMRRAASHHARSSGGIHGPELQRIATGHGVLELSIFEDGVPPRFRLSGTQADFVRIETERDNGDRQTFAMANRGGYWESLDEIPEPHGFRVTVVIDRDGRAQTYATEFTEHAHGHSHGHSHSHSHRHDADALYLPRSDGAMVLLHHVHVHRHGDGPPHVHLHDHDAATVHEISPDTELAPPLHAHRHKTTARTALLIILGSSPMVEGIPAFFAAAKYGVGLITAMAAVFALSTIATYVLLCVYSAAGLQRLRLGTFERYGEVLSGAFIALVGVVFYLWPVL
jgi:ABC-type nickel/cobalt efflux system permease component RcnA